MCAAQPVLLFFYRLRFFRIVFPSTFCVQFDWSWVFVPTGFCSEDHPPSYLSNCHDKSAFLSFGHLLLRLSTSQWALFSPFSPFNPFSPFSPFSQYNLFGQFNQQIQPSFRTVSILPFSYPAFSKFWWGKGKDCFLFWWKRFENELFANLKGTHRTACAPLLQLAATATLPASTEASAFRIPPRARYSYRPTVGVPDQTKGLSARAPGWAVSVSRGITTNLQY